MADRSIDADRLIELLRIELGEVRASDDRADRKAQILLAFTGVSLAVSIPAVGKWGDLGAVVLAYAAIAFLGCAALLLGLVVRPQMAGPAGQVSWNRLLLGLSSGPEVLRRVATETREQRSDRLAHLIYQLGLRARLKHRRIQWALVALVVGAVLLGAASILQS